VAGLAQRGTRGGADTSQLWQVLLVDAGDVTHDDITLEGCGRVWARGRKRREEGLLTGGQ
jgi:hypothetical protein